VGQVEAGRLDELVLGAGPLEEHDQLELEVDHWVDTRPVPLGIEPAHPVPDNAEIELRLKVAVEVIGGDHLLQRDGNGLVEEAGFGRTKHESAPDGTLARHSRGRCDCPHAVFDVAN
jgi:hypothetical protein